MIGGRNVFNQPIRNDKKTHDSIRKIALGQGDDYRIRCLIIIISKIIISWLQWTPVNQKILDADPKAIQ